MSKSVIFREQSSGGPKLGFTQKSTASWHQILMKTLIPSSCHKMCQLDWCRLDLTVQLINSWRYSWFLLFDTPHYILDILTRLISSHSQLTQAVFAHQWEMPSLPPPSAADPSIPPCYTWEGGATWDHADDGWHKKKTKKTCTRASLPAVNLT